MSGRVLLVAVAGNPNVGKTSVFNCISGIYPGEGAIRFRGADIAGKKPHDERSMKCAHGRRGSRYDEINA